MGDQTIVDWTVEIFWAMPKTFMAKDQNRLWMAMKFFQSSNSLTKELDNQQISVVKKMVNVHPNGWNWHK